MAKATFGAGCFWGVEERFRQVPGVVTTAVGYSGGTTENPTYEEVCTGETGHAEVVELDFDPQVVSYSDLLEIFWHCHDPTSRDCQGPDVGPQYRSVLFYHNQEQRELAMASKREFEVSGVFGDRILTHIEPAGPFYRAEEYHQQYVARQNLVEG